jgi:hypothetical protein
LTGLKKPDALLDAWRDACQPPAGQRSGFYTTLRGGGFEDATRRAFSITIFASFSAA